MAYLIDNNLPYRFGLWQGSDYSHVHDLNEAWSDREIWEYAKTNDMVIVSKDADFSDWILPSNPPPKVVHIRFGNLRIRDFYSTVHAVWPQVVRLVNSHKLIIVHRDRLETVA